MAQAPINNDDTTTKGITVTTLNETPYFPSSELPGVVGVFKRRCNLAVPDETKVGFSYWDGENWHVDAETPDEAIRTPLVTSRYQKGLWEDFEWCGVVPAEGVVAMADDDGVIQSDKSEPVSDAEPIAASFFDDGEVKAAANAIDSFFKTE